MENLDTILVKAERLQILLEENLRAHRGIIEESSKLIENLANNPDSPYACEYQTAADDLQNSRRYLASLLQAVREGVGLS